MRIIENLQKRVEAFRDSINVTIRETITDNEAFIIDMNVEDQLYQQGVNRNAVPISDYAPYRELTISIKRVKNQPTNRVTLRDTGDFHSSFYLQIGEDAFAIDARDSKTDDLIKKYGRQILGLTDENLTELIREYIYPSLIEMRSRVLVNKS